MKLLAFFFQAVETPWWERWVLPILFSIVTGIVTYLVSKPKTAAEIHRTDTETERLKVQAVRDTREDLKLWVERFSDLADEMRVIEEEFDEVRRTFRNFKGDVSQFLEKVDNTLATTGQFPNLLKEIQQLRERYKMELNTYEETEE